jgi:DNA polymerase III epsilon subunit-like protein
MPIVGQPIIFTDLETTGFKVDYHEIIEIGAVVTDHELNILDEIDLKVLPERIHTASVEALAVNGYTPEAWLGAVGLREAMEVYGQKARGAAFIGHNANFDSKFIRHAFQTNGIENTLDGRLVDNIWFAKHMLKGEGLERYSQKAVALHLGIEPEPDVHRAVNGARQAYQIYSALTRK